MVTIAKLRVHVVFRTKEGMVETHQLRAPTPLRHSEPPDGTKAEWFINPFARLTGNREWLDQPHLDSLLFGEVASITLPGSISFPASSVGDGPPQPESSATTFEVMEIKVFHKETVDAYRLARAVARL